MTDVRVAPARAERGGGLHPESDTRYFSLEQELDLAFSRGDDGKVTGFVLSAGPATYKANRID